MITWGCGFANGVRRFSRLLRGLGVIAMPDSGLDPTRRTEVPLGAGVVQLLVPSVVVGVFIDHHCVADGVGFTH